MFLNVFLPDHHMVFQSTANNHLSLVCSLKSHQILAVLHLENKQRTVGRRMERNIHGRKRNCTHQGIWANTFQWSLEEKTEIVPASKKKKKRLVCMSSSLKTPLEPLRSPFNHGWNMRCCKGYLIQSLEKGEDDGMMERWRKPLSYSILLSFTCPCLFSVYVGLRDGDYLLDFPHHHDAC